MNFQQFSHPGKEIFLTDMRKEKEFPFCELSQKALQKFLKAGKKIGILVARKGYASGVICHDCGHIPRCTQCDIAIAYHKADDGSTFGLCHICKRHYPADAICQQCGGHDVDSYGVGSQQISERLTKAYGVKSLIIESETANSPQKVKKCMADMAAAQVVIGTSLLTQPVRGVIFDLLIVVQADTGLHLPDVNACRNNFLILYSFFTKHQTPTFIVQTYVPEHYVIHHACSLDEPGFREIELAKRKEGGYPPYSQMCVLLYKHEIESRLYTSIHKLYQELLFLQKSYQFEKLEMYATPPMIYKIFGKFRYNIILKGEGLREFMDIAYSKLRMQSRGFKIDREPTSLV